MVYLRTLSPLKMFIIIFFFSLNLSCTCLSGLCDCSKAVGSRRRTGHGRHFLPRDTAKFSFFQRHREKMSQKKLFFCLKKKKFFLALPVACQKGTEEKIYILSDIQHTHTHSSLDRNNNDGPSIKNPFSLLPFKVVARSCVMASGVIVFAWESQSELGNGRTLAKYRI